MLIKMQEPVQWTYFKVRDILGISVRTSEDITQPDFKGDNSMSNVSFSVRKPRALILMPIIVGIIEGLFFCALIVLMLIYPNDTADLGVFFVFFAFIILGILLIIMGFCNRRWEVHIEGRQINYTPHIGNAKQFTFDSISRVQSIHHSGLAIGIAEIKFYVGDKVVFAVESSSREFNTLLSHLNNENISFS